MPSKDPIREDANLWLRHQQAEKVRKRTMPARLQILAHATHQDPQKLAERIPEDTLRRLKYPMIEQREDDGTSSFIHDKGIVEAGRPLLATDRGGHR